MAESLAASDRDVLVDAAAIGLVSLFIAVAADQLAFMTVVVPAVIATRLVVWLRRHPSGRARLTELVFYGICTLLGAFNDWSSVVRHGIYDYTVPVYFPEVSTVPIWMLLFWGLVLRFFVTLGSWRRVGLAQPRNEVRVGPWRARSPALKVALLLGLVVLTRQTIYRAYLDPVWSWAPFAIAGVVYAYLFGLRRPEIRLAVLVLFVGPLIEVLYIQVGGLHRYHLGWLGGVPVWIALWWVLAVLIWCDLGQRVRALLNALPGFKADAGRRGWADERG